MEESRQFGKRLRELRIQASFTLRDLAARVAVDFTYLSKIENGVLPPPSEKVILQLTEVLNADRDELITLAGRIPSDVVEILKSREALQILRSDHTRKKVKAAGQGGERLNMTKYVKYMKSMTRLVVPLLLVVAVATSLWYVSPTQALEISFPTLPSGNLGTQHTFTVKVTIQDPDLVPIQTVNVEIYNVGDATKKATLLDLPKQDTARQVHAISQGTSSGSAEMAAATGSGWVYSASAGTGYAAWNGGGYSFGSTRGYAYGPGGGGQTNITYTIYWTSPSGWPSGNYQIDATVNAESPTRTESFVETSSAFSLSTASTANGGGGGDPASEPEVTPEDVEELDDEEAADVLEKLDAEDAAAVIEEVATDKAADIIEEVATDKAADIIEEVATEKAVDIIEEVATDKAADILEEVSTEKAAAIMEELSTDKLNETIPEMSEAALTERLPRMTAEKLHSIDPEVLFDSLPNAPTEQLLGENPPVPPADLGEPVVVYTTPSGGRYLAIQTQPGEWVIVVGTPMPVDKLLIKTKTALANVETTLEILEDRPEEALVDLPADQVVLTYLSIGFENALPEDIEVGHMTFLVEQTWLEENNIHKWSVALNRYDPALNKWISLPTKGIGEDDTYVYYTVSISHFSIFAISGSHELAPTNIEVSNLSISSASVEAGESVYIQADFKNLSRSEQVYVATLWVNGTVESALDISLQAGELQTALFTVAADAAGSYEVRIDRLFDSFTVTEAAPTPPAPTPAPPAPTPAPPTKPAPTPSTPTPTPPTKPAPAPPTPAPPAPETNWWLIGGIIAAGAVIIVLVAWQIMVRRRD
ncbi:PGF-pre-PGF domain-containing protein [Chloroflexota bacterium]